MNSTKAVLLIMLALAPAFSLGATPAGLSFVETASGSQSQHTRELVQWTHSRLVFNKTLERVAVGREATLQLEVLNNNEVLVLAKEVGRTSVIAWYTDQTSETFLFTVVEDLSVLESVLRDIHPRITLTLAPDRAALILRGRVPTVDFRLAADSAARHYLDAGNSGQVRLSNSLIQTANSAGAGGSFQIQERVDVPQQFVRSGAAVINLIQVEQLPLTLPEKVKGAIDRLGGQGVTVSRIQQGPVANDEVDTLLLGGYVETQVDLVRVINLASRLFTGTVGDSSAISTMSAVANESGGLLTGGSGAPLGGNSLAGGFGAGFGSGAGATGNNLTSNVGRAKMLSAAGGRLLSTIEVKDLPQVRVAVQMYEVNRRRLKQWRPDFTLITDGYDTRGGAFGLGGATSAAANSGQIENALQVLGGALVNNLQVVTSDIAFDLLFSLMEQEGISRTMARPNLTVLSGESAVFRAGGEVPVPVAFAPQGIPSGDQGGIDANGVFSGTEFKPFGVELSVRAMVDENDRITLDLNPTISLPDTSLTQEISDSTGSALNTAAFNVRSLSTSTRLRDGQPLIIGGLVSRDISDNREFVPGASDVPVLGKLAEATDELDSDRELIIIVTPTIIREPRHDVDIWAFPTSGQLLDKAVLAKR